MKTPYFNRRRKLKFIVMAFYFVFHTDVYSEVIAECGEFSGYSYYHEGTFVPPEKAGMVEDGVTGGSTSIVKIDGKFDIIYTDARNKARSNRATGAKVLLIGANKSEGLYVFLSHSEDIVEIYTYNSKSNRLVLNESKFNGIINKSTLFVSKCDD